jgi:hypothetical protein
MKKYNEEYDYEVAYGSGYGPEVIVYRNKEEVARWFMKDLETEPDGSTVTVEDAMDSWYEDRDTEAEGNVSRPLDECDPWEEKEEIKHYNKEGEEVIKIEMPELPDFRFVRVGEPTPKGYRKVKMFPGARVGIIKRKGY